MEKLLERNEVEQKDKWDLESVYKNLDDLKKDCNQVEKNTSDLEKQQDSFTSSSKNFLDFLELYSATTRIFEKLYTYAIRKSDEDLANSTYQELSGKVQNLYQSFQEKTSFATPTILECDKSRILSYFDEEKGLEKYCHNIEDILRYKEHTLSKEEEKIVSAYAKVIDSSSDTASYLMDADLKFSKIKDSNNKIVELNSSNYSIYLKDKVRRVRKAAFLNYHHGYGSVKNTLTSTLAATSEALSTSSKLRNYSSSLEESLFSDNVPVELYNNLIETIHKNLPSLYEYYQVKQRILNLKSFHIYDSYVSVTEQDNKEYSFEEGQNIVLDALSILGDEYKEVLKTAFTDGWIDKYPNKNKKSGAYSCGGYDTKPFVLLNYTNTYNDVSTLAHELGHSMHTYFSNKYNTYGNHEYPIFLAEIASTVNEMLLSYYMEAKAKSKEEKLSVLEDRLNTFKSTIFRQTMFAEFEKYIHELTDKGEILTTDNICNYYYDLNRLYFGNKVVIDEEIKYECLRIPHFYSPFYVYKYATGLSIASYIAENIINETKGFKEKYIKFLKTSGRDYPLEVLKIIDVDLKDTKVFDEAMNVFRKTLDEFIELSK